MGSLFNVTISDTFSRPHFQSAEIVAGEKGLENFIRWVHILEVTEIGHLLNGDELILTTGVGWRKDENLGLSLLRQLIDKKAAGLCVELGTYIDSIPKGMEELANKSGFPIIVFKEQVRFIDITQDLNGLFMEAHNKMIVKLESISNQFSRLLLSADGFTKILRLLHKSLNVQVAYHTEEGEPILYPPVDKDKRSDLLKRVYAARPQSIVDSSLSSVTTISKPVEALGHKFADLIILTDGNQLSDYDYLVLDRAATALSQDQLRILYVEEKKKHEENLWVLEWLNGEHHKEDIERYLSNSTLSTDPKGCTVCICETNVFGKEADLTYYSMVFRSIFERQGFYSLVVFDQGNIIFALINERDQIDWKSRVSKAVKQISETDILIDNKSGRVNFGIGKLYELDELHRSYVKAKEVLYVQKKIGNTVPKFYEDLYVHRLILHLNSKKDLREYVDDYLGPVLQYDKERNSSMFETLKVYLEVSGSKKDAAERLFIVRQTLYHRLDKLHELLGKDFMDSEKRVAIHFAIYSKVFLDAKA